MRSVREGFCPELSETIDYEYVFNVVVDFRENSSTSVVYSSDTTTLIDR